MKHREPRTCPLCGDRPRLPDESLFEHLHFVHEKDIDAFAWVVMKLLRRNLNRRGKP